MKAVKLTDFNLFKNLPASLMDDIKQLPVTQLNKDEYIIKKGHKNYTLHLLVEGDAAVYLHESDEPLKNIHAGDTIGEISLIDQQPASASIICLCPCKVITVDETLLWKFARHDHLFTMNLLQLLVSRFRGVNFQLETSIEKQRLLERHASVDNLTGLFNRGWLNTKFNQLLERCQKNHQPFSYFMIDIDHFKKVNDNYGHLVGDLVLQITAKTLGNTARADDYVVRYGGEEMAILLPNTGVDNALKIAERLRQKVEINIIEYEPCKTLNITVSIGISTSNNNESDIELIKLADDALYYAKRHGRNQIKFNSGEL
ncbi:MAG: diguanylate cyclase [Methylococcaceae bacterium]|nr:diguanylate cyclase [Methylococcaceae bacterium]